MPVNEMTLDCITIESLKNIGGASSIAQAVMYQDQSASRNRLNIIAESLTAKAGMKIQSLDISEAAAESAVNRGGADSGLASLMAAISSGAINNKTVALTPPETGVSRSFGDLAGLGALIAALTK